MRKTFTNLDTTPLPTCKEAQKAYKDHCAGMREEKKTHCENLAAYKKLNPKCDKDCRAGHLSELKVFYDDIAKQDVIINDPNSSPPQKAAAEIKIDKNNKLINRYLAGVGFPKKNEEEIIAALKGLAAREITRNLLLDARTKLIKDIGKFKNPPCKLPEVGFGFGECAGDKKKKAHSERLKRKK
jgi:hypothetical protein